MTESATNFDDFEAHAPTPRQALVVTVDGFEGPLDLLLTLARKQKVDIAKISVLQARRPISGIHRAAKRLNLELAADYLVMAAWLAYLKSRLILPQEKGAGRRAHGRRNGDAAALAPAAAGCHARSGDPADGARAAGPRRLRRAAIRSRSMSSSFGPTRTRSTICSRPMRRPGAARLGGKAYQPVQMAPVLHIEEARERLERMLGTDLRLERSTRPPAARLAGRAAPALGPGFAPCWPAWNWRATASSNCSQLTPFDEIYVRDQDSRAAARP